MDKPKKVITNIISLVLLVLAILSGILFYLGICFSLIILGLHGYVSVIISGCIPIAIVSMCFYALLEVAGIKLEL